jgi:hypothetical protein
MNSEIYTELRNISKSLKNAELEHDIYTTRYNAIYDKELYKFVLKYSNDPIIKIYEPYYYTINYIEFTKRYLSYKLQSMCIKYVPNYLTIGFDCWDMISDYLIYEDIASLMSTNLLLLKLLGNETIQRKKKINKSSNNEKYKNCDHELLFI